MTSTGSNTSPLEPDAIAALIDMVGLDDPDFLIELIDTFLQDSSAMVEMMMTNWEEQDYETVMRTAHSLKSTSATFQATYLSQLSSDLELQLRGDDMGIDVVEQIRMIKDEYGRVKDALVIERGKIQ
ncbi:MAG: Hpt domain-containing protein [Chloroflexota bacterium]